MIVILVLKQIAKLPLDFMEKPPERSYQSINVLGTIYRDYKGLKEVGGAYQIIQTLDPDLLVDGESNPLFFCLFFEFSAIGFRL